VSAESVRVKLIVDAAPNGLDFQARPDSLPRLPESRSRPPKPCCGQVAPQARNGRGWRRSARCVSRDESGQFQNPSPADLGRRQARPRTRSVAGRL